MASSDLSNTLAIRLTRFFMRFVGFWIWKDRRGKIIMDLAMCYSIIAIVFAWIVVATDMWFSRQDFYQAAYAACNAMTILIILFKLIMFMIRRDAFLNLIKFCHQQFWIDNYDAFGRSVLRQCETRCVYFVGTFTFFAQTTVFTYTVAPILANIGKNETDRVLPFNIWVDLPVTTTPFYEILFFIETMSMYHSGICYFCFDNLLYIMNVHATGQFRILKRKFELMSYVSGFDERPPDTCRKVSSLNDDYDAFSTKKLADPRAQFGAFKDCVRMHQTLIRFTKMVEDVYTFVILGQVVVFSLLICLVTYQAILADGSSIPRRIIFIVHSGGTFAQLFMFTLTCDNLTQESLEVGEAAYRARWYYDLSDPRARRLGKDLILVIIRARRPCCLTAGGFFPVSLETFTTIMSTSMSYLTLLRQGQDHSLQS